MPIRVFIIDQHEIMRAGIKLACSKRDDLEFIGEADNVQQGREIARENVADVAIVDPASCGPDGLDQIRQLHEELPDLRILVFTADDGPQHAQKIMACGATGYLIKAAGLEEIAVAIRSVHLGRTFISHSYVKDSPSTVAAIAEPAQPLTSQCIDIPEPPQLSGREKEVLALLADGLTNKQAAESLFLSVKTVETYRARIMKKHDLRDRSELVRFARGAIGQMAASEC